MSAPPALAPPTLKTIPDGVPNRGPLLFGVYVGMIVPATVIVAVRLGWKYTQPKGLGLDDLFIFIAIVCLHSSNARVNAQRLTIAVAGLGPHRNGNC